MSDVKPGWKDLPKGAVATKSSAEYETGDWGIEKPAFDKSKCTKCTLCHFFCPEGAISIGDEEYPEVDERYCKGCGICADECPVNCLTMEMQK